MVIKVKAKRGLRVKLFRFLGFIPGLSHLIADLDRDDLSQLSGIDAMNPHRWPINPVATEVAGELLITDFFMSHKTFAFGTNPLPLDNLFARIAGTHSRPLSPIRIGQIPSRLEIFSFTQKWDLGPGQVTPRARI